MISIVGLERGPLLAALYNAAAPAGYGWLEYEWQMMTTEQAWQLLRDSNSFDYLNGRPLKVWLGPNETAIDELYYDRRNGTGQCQAVVTALRLGDPVDGQSITELHSEARIRSAERARADTHPTQEYVDERGVTHINLGLDPRVAAKLASIGL